MLDFLAVELESQNHPSHSVLKVMMVRCDGTLSQDSLREGRREKCEFKASLGDTARCTTPSKTNKLQIVTATATETPSATLSVVLAALIPTLAHESYPDTEV